MRSKCLILSLLIGLLLSAGCHRGGSYYKPPPIDGLRFTATAEVSGAARDSLLVRVTAHNASPHRRMLERGFCNDAIAVRLYPAATPHRNRGAPRWDSMEWRRAMWGTNHVCIASALTTYLRPGVTAVVARVWVPIRSILGDSLDPGLYRLTARLSGSDSAAGEIDAGIVELQPASR